jgi:RNA:NAD 2'-phosphotransferase (TPT1/KptA family)
VNAPVNVNGFSRTVSFPLHRRSQRRSPARDERGYANVNVAVRSAPRDRIHLSDTFLQRFAPDD